MLKDEGARAEVAKFKAQLDEWRKLDVDFQMVPEGPHTGFKDKTDLAFHFELGHPDLDKKTVISLGKPLKKVHHDENQPLPAPPKQVRQKNSKDPDLVMADYLPSPRHTHEDSPFLLDDDDFDAALRGSWVHAGGAGA